MNTTVGETEIRTQERGITFFQKTLGYSYLGNWHARQGNSNVEKDLLTDWLRSRQCDDEIITKVQETPLKGKCAIVTSYRPAVDNVVREETGDGLTDRQTEYYVYRQMLADPGAAPVTP